MRRVICSTHFTYFVEWIAYKYIFIYVYVNIDFICNQRLLDIMQNVKGYTSKILREEFLKLNKIPSLCTRSYFVSTVGNVCSETIKKYVEN